MLVFLSQTAPKYTSETEIDHTASPRAKGYAPAARDKTSPDPPSPRRRYPSPPAAKHATRRRAPRSGFEADGSGPSARDEIPPRFLRRQHPRSAAKGPRAST